MALSAADLMKRHHLEGTSDPSPPIIEDAHTQKQLPAPAEVDTSDAAFPALVSSTPVSATTTVTAWGGHRTRLIAAKPVFTDSFTLVAIDLSGAGKNGRPATVGEIMRQVMAKYKVKIEASATQKTRQTTFHVKADTQKELDKAKRTLLALLSPVIDLVIQAPVSTIPAIIGPKGSTIKQIREQTGVQIDIPPRDSLNVSNGNGNSSAPVSGKATPLLNDDDEPTVPVTVTGPQPYVDEAQVLLNQIISSRTSKSTQRIRHIPAHVLPFVLTQRSVFLSATSGKDIALSLNASSSEITVSGDREAVIAVAGVIRDAVESLATSLTSLKLSLPKRQHRLLVGKAVDEILTKSKCSVVVADYDDPSDEVVVWGHGPDLPTGLSAVMERANSQYIHEFPLPGPLATSRQILVFMVGIQYANVLTSANPGISVFLPTPTAVEKGQNLTIDLVGDKTDVDATVRQISEIIGKLINATRELQVDWLVHRIITGKYAKKLKAFYDGHNVQIFFPPESAEKSSVVLVYDPLSPSASPLPDEKKRHLDEVEKELLKLAKDAADVKTEKVAVEARWHEAIVGQDGTTLNALMGEDRTISIKIGAEVGDASTNDIILVRGASVDVDRVVKEILRTVEAAKNNEIVNSYSTEFEIDREYVGRVVGAHGVGINRLRDQLGVKVDVSDDFDEKEKEKEKESGKRRKGAIQQKSKIKITGRQENAEEAKRRILNQVDRLADETSETLKIPAQYHPSLIGQNGKYAIRLEERHMVKITFPRQPAEGGEGRTREQLKPDEVLIKGGKRGVAGAKSELLEAYEFEKESNHSLAFTVPNRCVARILGKGGASINEIKDDTGAHIDVGRPENGENVTKVTVRGTKQATALAKTAILAIADSIPEEIMATLTIESRFHRALIGAGGQGLKDLIVSCGGPTDSKLQSSLIRFPRFGEEPADEVKLRGEAKLVNKLKVELEKAASVLRDRVILAVEIPAAQHRALIGRGGQHLNDLQNRHNVQVQFPASRSYHQVGEPENEAEFAKVDPANVVKVSGLRKACEDTIVELKSQIRPPTPEALTTTVSVPLKYHYQISQHGNFFRTLRSLGVHVEQSVFPTRVSTVPSRDSDVGNSSENSTSAARIDEAGMEDTSTELEAQWEVVENYQDAEEGDSIWIIKARDQAGLEQAEKLLQDAIDHASSMSHVGFLTLSDRSVFPRIVGTKGANIARLRNETGADVIVGRDNNTIVVIGSESNILAAKTAILLVASRSRRRSDA